MEEYTNKKSRLAESRRLNQKFYRNRNVWTGDGFISKKILYKDYETCLMHETEMKQVFEAFDDDGTGLNTGVKYSLKKKNRHLLPDMLEKDLPIIKAPVPLETVSLIQVTWYRGETSNPSYMWNEYWRNGHIRNCHGKIKKLQVHRADGSVKEHSGAISNTSDFLTKKDRDNLCVRYHLQYEVIEYETSFNQHNCRKWECFCCSLCRDSRRYRRTFSDKESIQIGKDIQRSGYLEYEEEFKCCSNPVEENMNILKPIGITLGDCFVTKKKKQGKRRVSDDWVIL